MEGDKILFEIKNLERTIGRCLTKNCELNKEKIDQRPTPTQMQIIEYILEHKNEDIYQKDLEEILDTRRATVSGVLQTMEKNGIIKRITNTEDTRSKKIILCEKTEKIFLDNKEKLKMIEEILVTDIPKEELEVFSKVIKKMKNNIENRYKEDKNKHA